MLENSDNIGTLMPQPNYLTSNPLPLVLWAPLPSSTNNNKCQMFNDAEKQRTSLVAAAAASIVACNAVEAEAESKAACQWPLSS